MGTIARLEVDVRAVERVALLAERASTPPRDGGPYLLDEEIAFIRAMDRKLVTGGPGVSYSETERAELARLIRTTEAP